MWGFYIEQLIHSLPFFLKGLWMTIAVSGLSLLAGTAIGFIWGILRASRSRFVKPLIGAWVDVVRGTPFLVQIFIIFFLLPEFGIQLEAFPAAVIALTNLAACFICEIVAAGIQAVPSGQKEAATSTGLNGVQQLRYVMDVTRVGWLTVQRVPQGLLVFGLVAVLYFIVCYPLIRISNRLEKRMSAGVTQNKM
jgi:polar amino acid transport system permease protein